MAFVSDFKRYCVDNLGQDDLEIVLGAIDRYESRNKNGRADGLTDGEMVIAAGLRAWLKRWKPEVFCSRDVWALALGRDIADYDKSAARSVNRAVRSVPGVTDANKCRFERWGQQRAFVFEPQALGEEEEDPLPDYDFEGLDI